MCVCVCVGVFYSSPPPFAWTLPCVPSLVLRTNNCSQLDNITHRWKKKQHRRTLNGIDRRRIKGIDSAKDYPQLLGRLPHAFLWLLKCACMRILLIHIKSVKNSAHRGASSLSPFCFTGTKMPVKPETLWAPNFLFELITQCLCCAEIPSSVGKMRNCAQSLVLVGGIAPHC